MQAPAHVKQAGDLLPAAAARAVQGTGLNTTHQELPARPGCLPAANHVGSAPCPIAGHLAAFPRPPHLSTLLASRPGSVCPLHPCSCLASMLTVWGPGLQGGATLRPSCAQPRVPHSHAVFLACRDVLHTSLQGHWHQFEAGSHKQTSNAPREVLLLSPVSWTGAASLLPPSACRCKLELTIPAGPAAESTAVCRQADR